MNYKIETIPRFDKDIKKLKKRFPKIKNDLIFLIEELSKNPNIGTHLENSIFKIRLQNSSIPTGKSGGFRVIYYFIDAENNLYLMSIYSKTQKENISENELLELLSVNGLS
jgi:mRNA-degrading endonuclease RelE of RelBE toxin-antitoxin system